MAKVVRRFTQLEPNSESLPPQPLSSFDATPALVVLGDPGAGKTTSFQAAAGSEPGAIYVSVRDFLTLSPERWQGKRLYLDGLDEQRSKTKDGAGVLDQVRARLDQLGPPSFRLSCRAADWFGGSDLAALRVVSPTQSVTVIRLEPLSEQDIHDIASEVLSNADSFIAEAKRRGLYEFLTNPQTLQLILAAVSENEWPATRTQLYQKGVRILAREMNPEHRDFLGTSVNTEDILDACGYLCSVHLCAGTAGISLTDEASNKDFPYVGELPGNRETLAIALRRRVFQAEGAGRVRPIHRTVAEFLGALYLAKQLKGNLGLGRVLALITGLDGGTLSDLRGLYAWLACLCLQFAETLMPRDPLAVVLYGDPALLSTSTKILILKSLADLSRMNPWFRSEDWSSRQFGSLSSPEMEPEFRRALSDNSQHPVFISCVLDAIANGPSMPQLGDLLLSIASDSSKPEFVRRDAISAFHSTCPERVTDLKALLDSIHRGEVSDPTCVLRGDLLDLLYPGVVPPEAIAARLVDEPEGQVTSYTMFVSRDLVDRTPPEALPPLLDSLSIHANRSHQARRLIWTDSVARVILKLLAQRGAEVEPGVVYEWLGKSVDNHGQPIPGREDAEAIRHWLEGHPALIRQLFSHWVATTPFASPVLEEHDFWQLLYRAKAPDGFPRWLCDLAVRENRSHVAHFLFRLAIQYTMAHGREDGLKLDELFAFVDQHPQFRTTLQAGMAWEIPEWKIEEAIAREEKDRRDAARRHITIERLQQNIDAIRLGSALSHLRYLAQLYYGLFIDVDRNLSPEARLAVETNSNIAEVAREGFIAVLESQRIPTPRQIAETHLQTKEHLIRLPILAGMEILARERPDAILALPDRTLEAALAFFYVGETSRQPDWMQKLVTQRPELSARALRAFWSVCLKKQAQYVPGIHDLLEEHMNAVARTTALPLLRKFPICREESLRVLLRASVNASPALSVSSVARQVLRGSAVRGIQRILWRATAFALQPEEYTQGITSYAARLDLEGIASFLTYLQPSLMDTHRPPHVLSIRAKDTLIRLFGPVFPPKALTGSGWLGQDTLGKGAGSIQSMIEQLKKHSSTGASLALASLRDDPKLRTWRDYLSHAVAEQARLRRETEFRYPELPHVIDTLQNGKPANARDLQALLLIQLSVLHERLRHGPTDGYKTFWNVDPLQRPSSPKPEEYCRDRIIDLLHPLMTPFEVTLEPEGHHALDKRVDIKCLATQVNIPLEIKRHYHRQLWTAPLHQLKKLYSRDPGAKGRGIYLVLWFGLTVKPLPPVPPEVQRLGQISSPQELGNALRLTLPEPDRDLIEIVVFDCSITRAPRTRSTRQKT
jgi:hypothetical protein